MSPVGANVPTYLRFMNGNITEVTPEKLPKSPPIFFNGMGHLSPCLQSLGRTLMGYTVSIYVNYHADSNQIIYNNFTMCFVEI